MSGLRSIKCALAALSLSICGCEAFQANSLWSNHMADNQHEAAQQRWNDVRGNVKLQIVEQHFKAGRMEEAELTLTQVLAMSPNNPEAYKLATRLHLECGQLAKASETIDTAASLVDEDAEVEYLAGIVAQRYGELDKALNHYLAAEELASNVAEYVMAAAEMWVAKGEPAHALSLVESRLRDFDGSMAMRMLAAQICRRLERKEQALAHSREALRIQHDDARTQVEAALILSWAKAHDEVIEILQPLVDKMYGEVKWKPGGRNTASRAFRDAAIITPTVVHALARAYADTKQWNRSQVVLRPLMQFDQTDITAWSLFARSALMSGNLEDADKAITEFNRRNPPTAETLLLKAYISYKRGDYASTREAAEKAFQLDNQMKPALWLSGQAARATGRIEQAKDAYARALAMDPDSKATRAMLAALSEPVTPSGAIVAANRPRNLNAKRRNASANKPDAIRMEKCDSTAKLHVPDNVAELYEGLEP
ncbi:MAG: tetratricopeptide repeat protein [Phycisphaerales bacterium]|nr:tetratricopeptide repeat protein [Phycisphaerales bacterium]